MKRREFITLLGGVAAAWPLSARAQQRMKRIGILLFSKQQLTNVEPMLRALEALGYVDGRNIIIEYRPARSRRSPEDKPSPQTTCAAVHSSARAEDASKHRSNAPTSDRMTAPRFDFGR
jgi:hypothetical protein